MNSNDVVKIINRKFKDIEDIFKTKGQEYANNDDDQLDNFKRLSKNLGMPPEKCLMVYATKHFDSLNYFIKNIENSEYINNLSEPIEGRISDIILYMCLLEGLIVERNIT